MKKRRNRTIGEPLVRAACYLGSDVKAYEIPRNGIGRQWYVTGELWWEATFRNGQNHGEYIEYYKDGTVSRRIMYNNGGRHGLYASFYPDGKKQYETMFNNNKPVWSKQFYPSGCLMADKRFSKGKTADEQFFPDVYTEESK